MEGMTLEQLYRWYDIAQQLKTQQDEANARESRR